MSYVIVMPLQTIFESEALQCCCQSTQNVDSISTGIVHNLNLNATVLVQINNLSKFLCFSYVLVSLTKYELSNIQSQIFSGIFLVSLVSG